MVNITLEIFTAALQVTSLAGKTQQEQLDILALLFDGAYDFNNANGFTHGLSLASEIKGETMADSDKILLHYYQANAWGGLRKQKPQTKEEAWDFQQEEIAHEIFHLRKAMQCEGFADTQLVRRCQVMTNLASSYNFVGRCSEAQVLWSKALHISPGFAMAEVNKGYGLMYYSRYLFDNVHANIFLAYAYHFMYNALRDPKAIHHLAMNYYQEVCGSLGGHLPDNLRQQAPALNSHTLGDDPAIKEYRLWALQHRLYINPLLDIGPYSIASHDCLNMPSLTLPSRKPPVYLTLYNQLKQEFGTARFLLFEGLEKKQAHYADEDILLVDTYEEACYSISLEKVKIAFRMAYSILDKIAFLLNDYMAVGLKPREVSYKKIWKDEKTKALRPMFRNSDNWPLRGLYWLTNDLQEEGSSGFVPEPDAGEIAAIRNHIEHKAFKVVSGQQAFDLYDPALDISFSITRSFFEKKTLKLLQLVRSAMIYLPLAIHHEERKKHYEGESLPIHMETLQPWQKQ